MNGSQLVRLSPPERTPIIKRLLYHSTLRDFWRGSVVSMPLVPSVLRVRLLFMGRDSYFGKCRIAAFGFIGSGALILRYGVSISYAAFLDPTAGITVDKNSRIGPRVTIVTSSHVIGPTADSRTSRAPGTEVNLPVHIEENCWIGAGAILPGVTIGSGSVVAAGAVVAVNVAPNTLVGGVPAKLIRELPV